MAHGVDVELAGAHRLQHALIEHQVGDVGMRDDHPLLARQATRLAEPEETLDLLVDPADRLHFAELVDRTGDGEALLERRARQRGDQRAHLAQRGAVAIDVAIGLLQGDARGNLQREFLGIATAEEAGQDHHPLGVDRLAEAHLAFDIDDAAAAGIDGGGNTRRHAEVRVADGQHGEAVALAHGSATGVDEDDTGQHVIDDPRRDPPGAGRLGLQRALDMADLGDAFTGQLTDEVGLADQLEQIADPRRQAPLMLGQTRTVGGQACHGRAGERRHALFRGAGLHQLGELLQAVLGQRDVLVEVNQHAEHLLEVRIVILQRVIELARADDHHLELQRDDLRVEGHGGNAAQVAQRRLHLQLARMQGALQRLPDEGLAEQLLRLDHQVAAVGPMQGAGTQLPIAGVQRPLVGAVFDTAEQVVVGRVRLEHHRRAAIGVMADHQARAVHLFQQLAQLRVGLVHIHQLLDRGLQQVDLHGLQVGADTGVLRVLLRQRRQQRLQGHGDGLFVELTQQVARFALPLRQARQFFVQALFQLGDIGMEALAVGLRQLGELGLVQRLAVRHRGEGDVAAVAVQRHALLQRQALNHVQRLVVALVEATVDGALLLLVGRRLEHRREGGQQVVDQLIDIGDEIAGGAGRQLQGAWLAWLVEVVDVDAVGRGVHALGFRLEVALDEGEAPGTRLAHDEHVVARARHGHAELQGLDRARLAQHAAEGFEIIGTVEIELLGGEGAGQ